MIVYNSTILYLILICQCFSNSGCIFVHLSIYRYICCHEYLCCLETKTSNENNITIFFLILEAVSTNES